MPLHRRFSDEDGLATILSLLIFASLLYSPPLRGEALLYFNNENGPLHRSALDGGNVSSPFAPTLGTQVGYLQVTHEFI